MGNTFFLNYKTTKTTTRTRSKRHFLRHTGKEHRKSFILEHRMMEMVATTAATRHAKLHSNHDITTDKPCNIQPLQAGCPS